MKAFNKKRRKKHSVISVRFGFQVLKSMKMECIEKPNAYIWCKCGKLKDRIKNKWWENNPTN